MKDIVSRSDIMKVLEVFYDRVLRDDVIGYIFTDVAHLNLEEHLPKIGDFWEGVVLGAQVYRGNPMQVHLQLDKMEPLTPEHFQRWLQLFFTTIDELYTGFNADQMKQRANDIASVMEYKIKSARKAD